MHLIEQECKHDIVTIEQQKSVFVVDGNALIRSITRLLDTFGEFVDVLFKALPKCGTVHFVTDSYYPQSIKTLERERRGSCAIHAVGGPTTKMPRDFSGCMHEAENKRQLLNFLLTQWQQPQFAPHFHGRLLFFVFERQCTRPSSTDAMTVDVSDAPDLHSSQEEADSRIILHCAYIARCAEPHVSSIVICSPDTDVFILLLHYSSSITGTGSLRLLFDTGTGNNRRVLDITNIASAIGHDICFAQFSRIYWMWLNKCVCETWQEETVCGYANKRNLSVGFCSSGKVWSGSLGNHFAGSGTICMSRLWISKIMWCQQTAKCHFPVEISCKTSSCYVHESAMGIDLSRNPQN